MRRFIPLDLKFYYIFEKLGQTKICESENCGIVSKGSETCAIAESAIGHVEKQKER